MSGPGISIKYLLLWPKDLNLAYFQRGQVGTCSGDSGAPLVKYMSSKEKPYYQLLGVLHGSSDMCNEETAVTAPGLYARVSHPEIHAFIMKTKRGKWVKK